MAIRNTSRNTILADRVTVADSPSTRMKGLLGRTHLPEGEALVISQCQSVHMMFMSFAIDVVFIDQQSQVVGLCRKLKPFAFSPIFWKSSCAIELPAGRIDQTQTCLGDKINLDIPPSK